jgi:hypothetical protein
LVIWRFGKSCFSSLQKIQLCVKIWRVGDVVLFSHRFGKRKGCLTKRALDAGDSAAFSSIFLASSFSCSQAESTPAPAPITQTVGQPKAKNKIVFESQSWFYVWLKNSKSIF